MAWDTEDTKRRLLMAAIDEFAKRGLAGARVDRIAQLAGLNKERIYQYFGNKEALFDHAVSTELRRVMADVQVRSDKDGLSGLADYAGRLFDYHASDPKISRLLNWEGLERGAHPVNRAERIEQHAGKIDEMSHLLPSMTRDHVIELFITLIGLVTSRNTLGQLDTLFAPSGSPGERRQRHRAAVIQAVTSFAESLLT